MKIVKIKTKGKIYNYRPKIPIKNINWEFRKGDDDYRPSVPHGHSLEGKKLTENTNWNYGLGIFMK